ncbi:MAG: alpha/beta hydrolase [Crocinitomicaceae bacterium]|nr:alpha/beta hydrolase [Crocinitomicaceae bacterium]
MIIFRARMPFIEHHPFRLEYTVSGSGDNIIVFFHGFGRTSADVEFFLPLLKPCQRILSVNLFAHGNSIFPYERIDDFPLRREEWKEMMFLLMNEFSIERVDIIGYSMGGRVAMTTALIMPERINSLLLLAPDGFKINRFYRFAVETSAGKWLYRRLIDNPAPLFSVASMLNKAGLMNDKLYRFVTAHLDTEDKRWQVHDAWMIYRDFFPDLVKLAEMVNEKRFRFNMIFGKYDSVIKPALGEKFNKRLNSKHHFHIVESGHRILGVRTMELLKTSQMWP